MTKLRFHAPILAFLLLACAARADESYFLENGLKVILAPRPASPVVAARVLVKVGAAEEATPTEYGLAHLNEHMAFKTTAKRKVGEIFAVIEKNGGNANAYTSRDETVYLVNLPADSTGLALDVLADLVFAPLYDPDEFASEKEVVVEEIRRRDDNPNALIYDQLSALVYPGHPYGRPVIGSMESVRGVTLEQAWAFHNAYYRPDNAVLIVSGGFDVAETKEDILEYFGELRRPDEPLVRPAFPPVAGVQKPNLLARENRNVALAKVFLGFGAFSAADPRSGRADLLAAALSSGRASRLEEAVKNRQGLVSSIFAHSDSPRDKGVFLVGFETETDKIPAAVRATLAELTNIAAQPFTSGELEKARALAKLSLLRQRETVEGVARMLGDFEHAYGDWRLVDAYLPQWDRIGSSDLTRLAGELFVPGNLAVSVLLPEGAPDPTEELKAILDAFDPKPAGVAAPEKPDFEKVDLLAGVELWVMRDPDADLVSVAAGVAGGLFAEGDDDNGVGNFTAGVWPKATVDRDAAALSLATERLGAWISAQSGRNSLRLRGTFINDAWREGLALFLEVLTRPAFDPANVEEVRQEILAEIATRDENPDSLVVENVAALLYPGHPYRLTVQGSAENVAAFTADDLAAHYRRFIHPGALVIAVAGNLDPQTVREELADGLRGWKADSGDVAAFAEPPAPIASPAVKAVARDFSQARIVFGFQGVGIADGDAAALRVLFGHLSGSGGPLFMKLREEQSLAYSVTGWPAPGVGAGDLKFYIGTDPEKAAVAFSGMRDVIERTVRDGVSEEDVEDARRYLLGQYKFEKEGVGDRTESLLSNILNKVGKDFDEQYLAAIAAVTPEDVRRVAKKYLDFDRVVYSLIGPEAALEAVLELIPEAATREVNG